MESNSPLVGITMGDPVGVGPEIIPKAHSDPRVLRGCRPFIYGEATRLRAGAVSTGVRLKIAEMSSINDVRVGHDGIPVINPAAIDIDGLKWG